MGIVQTQRSSWHAGTLGELITVSGVKDPTAYYYSTYIGEDKTPVSNGRKVMVLGGGPNRIGQGIEFDYCCVHAALHFKRVRL